MTVVSSGIGLTMRAAKDLCTGVIRRYHRLDIDDRSGRHLTSPALFVGNHGFGTVLDLNVFALVAALEDMGLERPVTILVHEMAWTLGLGALLEPLGARPASLDNARAAFAAGHHVVVLPGGDVDAFKPYRDRNTIVFDGREGFARLAVEAQVPIVPVVTAGAGDTLLVLSSGRGLARLAGLDKVLRMRTLPVTFSLPWGLNVGAVGFLSYLPLPVKLSTRVLPPIDPVDFPNPTELAAHVTATMQDALDDLAGRRRAG